MWTSIVDLSPKRIILTSILGRFWRGAYFSSFAPLRVQNTPRQPLADTRWVRVRNRLAGICGSDLHLIYADGDLRVAPAALPGNTQTYLGHEVVGEVIEIGDDVQHTQVGDRVVLQHGINCLSSGVQPLCRFCASGDYGLCERRVHPGPHPIGGGWSEEMLLHEQQLFCVPPDMTDSQAVLLEPSAVAVHAVLRHVPQTGDRVLIIGAGTIGLLTLQVVRALAPQAEISVQARYPFQVEKATRMGASHIIYPQDSYTGVQQATNAQLYTGMLGNQMLMGGYDVIYDTIGTQQTIHNALRWACAKATVVLVGLSLHMMHIDLTPVWYQEINLIGTFGQGMENWPLGSTAQRSTFSITTDMIMNGLLHPEQLITHHFALNNYRQALMTAINKRDQRAIKVVFDYSLLPASVVPNVRASARTRRPTAVDNRNTSFATRDLAAKETGQSLSEQPATPMFTSQTIISEERSSVVPVSETRAQARPETILRDTAQTLVHEEEPVVTDLSSPSLTSTIHEDGENVQEQSVEAAKVVHASERVLVDEDAINRSLQTPEPSFISSESAFPLEEEASQATNNIPMERVIVPSEPFDEIPLNDLEWLEVMNAQQDVEVTSAEHDAEVTSAEHDAEVTNVEHDSEVINVEQDIPEMHYEPDVENETPALDISSHEEETWLDEGSMYEEKQQEIQDEDILEDQVGARANESETNVPYETLLTTKTTKAIVPGRSRSKNRHKGKNTTGSYRS